jgi:uncharacterized coiled-coil protein SlyX
MFNGDFDPFEKLHELYLRDVTHEHNIDTVSDRLAQACELMEQMAAQIKHLTTAVIGLQEQNRILHNRVTRLEDVHG